MPVFNDNPANFIDLNNFFAILNDKVGLTSEQFKLLVENTNYLYNNLGLADVEVGTVTTNFTSPGTLSDVVVTHSEEVVSGKTIDKFNYVFNIPSPTVTTEMQSSTTTNPENVGIDIVQTPILNSDNVIIGYNFKFVSTLLSLDISSKENTSNKVSSINNPNNQSQTYYPNNKAVYDFVSNGYQAKIDSNNKLSADLVDDGTTNKVYTATEQTKLSGIESGAQVNTVNSVNSKTGTVVLDADDIDDTSTTNKFVTSAEKTQITTNATAISNIKDGTTIDSFGDVETALSGKQSTLTFDNTPTANSNNPVKSGGIKSYVDNAISTAITTTLNTPV